MKKTVNKAVLCGCIGVLIPLLDHLTKFLVRTFMEVGDSIPVIKGFFHLTYVLNDGMAFGMAGEDKRWIFMLMTPVALIGVIVYLVLFFKKLDTLSCVSLVMILMGGASNMVDRIFFIHLDPTSSGLFDGRVVDMLDFCGIWNAVFNVADSFVVVGVFLFLFAFIMNDIKEAKAKKAALAAKEDETQAQIPAEKSKDEGEAQ
ncbi:MAG: signal peptidase II [Clostridia bacterium]|nr:signal peptidase II [Clostridia bacterium]